MPLSAEPGSTRSDRADTDLSFSVIVSSKAIDCPLGDGLAILDTRTNCYFSLNATGALIWNAARVPATPGMLCDAVAAEFDCESAGCEADVRALLTELLEAGLMLRVEPNG